MKHARRRRPTTTIDKITHENAMRHLPVRPVRAPPEGAVHGRRAAGRGGRRRRGHAQPAAEALRHQHQRVRRHRVEGAAERLTPTTTIHCATAFAGRNWRRNESSGVVSGLRRAGETRGRAAVGHGSDPIDDATTFWELLERRAERTPDAPMLIDEHDRTVTFGECRAWAERVAAGLVGLGVTADTPVAWQLPTRIESIVLSFALARLGTTQLPIIPIYREREVGSVLVQAGVRFFVVPGTWRDFDYEAMAKGLQDSTGEPFEILVVTDTLPEGDPATLPAPPTDGDAVRWIYYTSGTTAGAEGRDAHRQRADRRRDGTRASPCGRSRDDVGSIAFPFTHIGGPDYLVVMLAVRLAGRAVRDVRARQGGRGVRASRRHDGGRQHRVLPRVPQRAAQGPVEAGAADAAAAVRRRGAEAAGGVPTRCSARCGIPVCHGYGMTECPMITQGSPDDTDEQLANTEGTPVRGLRRRRSSATTARRCRPASRARCGSSGPMVCQGLHRSRARRPPRSTTTASSAPATSGTCAPTATSCSPAALKDVIIRKGENIIRQGDRGPALQTHPKVGRRSR